MKVLEWLASSYFDYICCSFIFATDEEKFPADIHQLPEHGQIIGDGIAPNSTEKVVILTLGHVRKLVQSFFFGSVDQFKKRSKS